MCPKAQGRPTRAGLLICLMGTGHVAAAAGGAQHLGARPAGKGRPGRRTRAAAPCTQHTNISHANRRIVATEIPRAEPPSKWAYGCAKDASSLLQEGMGRHLKNAPAPTRGGPERREGALPAAPPKGAVQLPTQSCRGIGANTRSPRHAPKPACGNLRVRSVGAARRRSKG